MEAAISKSPSSLKHKAKQINNKPPRKLVHQVHSEVEVRLAASVVPINAKRKRPRGLDPLRRPCQLVETEKWAERLPSQLPSEVSPSILSCDSLLPRGLIFNAKVLSQALMDGRES